MGILVRIDQPLPATARHFSRSWLGRVLFIKIKAINPERFIERTFPLVKPLFSAGASRLYVLMVVVAALVLAINLEQLHDQARTFFRPTVIPLVWITIFFVTLIHELAHTYACRLRGGRVNDMGFLLLYFQPCFYSNVSDAYLFPEKKERMAVTLAGIYSQVIVAASAVLLWRLTSPDNLVNSIAFIIIVLSAVGIIFNLNPLIKLDAYYLLVDLWEIPNLRSKAFLYLRQRWIGLAPGERQTVYSDLEKKRLTYYGLSAITYSGGLIMYLAYLGLGFLRKNVGSLAVALALAIMLYMLLDAMKKGKVFQVLYNQRGALLRPQRLVMAAILAMIVLLAGIFVRIQLRLTNDCLILPYEQVVLRLTSPGTAELHVEKADQQKSLKQYQLTTQDFSVLLIVPLVKVGDVVDSGQLVATIQSNAYEAEKQKRHADLQQARRQLDLLEQGPRKEEIRQTEDIIRQVSLKLQQQEADLIRAETLFAKGMLSHEQVEQKRTSVQVSRSELDFYKNQLILLRRGARPEELDIARAKISQLEAQIRHLENQIENASVYSPVAGVVTEVSNGNTVIAIARLDSVRAWIYVPERQISAVQVNMPVSIKVNSFPYMTYHGHVARIDPLVVDSRQGRPVVIVTASAANDGAMLKPGMTGKAKISCGKRRLYRVLLWRLVRYLRVEFWSLW